MMETKKISIEVKGMKFPNLIEIIKACGLSTDEFADKIGVTRQSVHLWLSGNKQKRTSPTIKNMIASCEVLGITENEFLQATGFDTSKIPSNEGRSRTVVELTVNIYNKADNAQPIETETPEHALLN